MKRLHLLCIILLGLNSTLISVEAVVVSSFADAFWGSQSDSTTVQDGVAEIVDPGGFLGIGSGFSRAKAVSYQLDDLGDPLDNNFTVTSSGVGNDPGGFLVDMDRGLFTSDQTDGTNSSIAVDFTLQDGEALQLDSSLDYFFEVNQDDQLGSDVISLSMTLINVTDSQEVFSTTSSVINTTDQPGGILNDTLSVSELVENTLGSAKDYRFVISMELLVTSGFGGTNANDIIRGGWQDASSALVISSTEVPEPQTFALVLGALAGLFTFGRRRR